MKLGKKLIHVGCSSLFLIHPPAIALSNQLMARMEKNGLLGINRASWATKTDTELDKLLPKKKKRKRPWKPSCPCCRTPNKRRRRKETECDSCFLCLDCPRKTKFKSIVKDILSINANIINFDSFKTICAFLPAVGLARMFDKDLQGNFYDRSNHKNCLEPPKWCQEVAKLSISIPIVFFGLKSFFSNHDEFCVTTRMLLLGMPFVIWSKELLKKLKLDICKRPWNEHFSCKEQSLGGFPSGHAAEAVYTALLYGMRLGPRYAIPTGTIALIIGSTFIACNRHYLSQIIAGAGLGTIYALAANKVVERHLDDPINYTVELSYTKQQPAVSFGVRF